MEFSIPLPNGDYTVNLFVGNSFSGTDQVGERIFDILLEGNIVEDNLDLIVRFGHKVTGMLSYPVTVNDGILNIAFGHEVENPLVNAIEIIGQSAGSSAKQQPGTKEDSDLASNKNAENVVTNSYEIKVHPNPASSTVNIEWSNSTDAIEKVYIHNMSGSLVKIIDPGTAALRTINVDSFEDGFYVLTFTTKNGGVYRERIVVKK